jgi:hypothetical protein
MPLPSTGLTQVDRLILRAAELGLPFPPDVKRWQLLTWAAEARELERSDPTRFQRGGFAEIHARHFPTAGR